MRRPCARLWAPVGRPPPTLQRIVMVRISKRTILLLVPGRSPQPSEAWPDSLVSSGLIDDVCRAASADSCPESVPATFLTPSLPTFPTDATAALDLTDAVMDPAACRRKAGVFLGGTMMTGVDLHRQNGGWRVVGTSPRIHASTACGFTPQEEERMARRQQDDSLLRERLTPIAGTYRLLCHVVLGGVPREPATPWAPPPSDLPRDINLPQPGWPRQFPMAG